MRSSAIRVMNNQNIIDLEKPIKGQDIVDGVSDVTAYVAEDDRSICEGLVCVEKRTSDVGMGKEGIGEGKRGGREGEKREEGCTGGLEIEEFLGDAAGVGACYCDVLGRSWENNRRKQARKDRPMIVWGASMPMAPSSANVGIGEWVWEKALVVVRTGCLGRKGRKLGRGKGRMTYLFRSMSSGMVAGLGAAILRYS